MGMSNEKECTVRKLNFRMDGERWNAWKQYNCFGLFFLSKNQIKYFPVCVNLC